MSDFSESVSTVRPAFLCREIAASLRRAIATCSSSADRWANTDRILPTKHRWVWRIASSLFAAMAVSLCWQPLASAQQYPSYPNSYNHNSGAVANYADWMKNLPDGAVLASLSLPGTHDSGTVPGGGGDGVQTQSMSVAEQLTSGIRFLDIRLRYMNPNATYTNYTACSAGASAGSICGAGSCYSISSACDLWGFHGDFFQNVRFSTGVLLPVVTFLSQHPTEVVVMRIGREPGAIHSIDSSDINDPMQQLLQGYARYIVPHRCIYQGTGTSNRLPLPSWASSDNYNPLDPPLQLGSTNSGTMLSFGGCAIRLRVWAHRTRVSA